MIRPPFAARVMAGLAVTLVEETRKLPATAVTFPMTAVSQLLQTSMRVQQKMTELAIKGDQAFSWLYPPQEEPSWVVFDEDRVETTGRSAQTAVAASAESRARQGRFALYSAPVPAGRAGADSEDSEPAAPASEPPAVAERLDYSSLTLAQLRARLKQLSTEELNDLLAHEEQSLARAPFLTLLSNRISATAK